MTDTAALPPDIAARQRWMGILAEATPAALEDALARLGALPPHDTLRAPEVGSALVRGRAGGTGAPFNLGEMTITRCAVTLEGRTGFGYVAGRNRRHAELAALFDALLQDDARRPHLERTVLAPLAAARDATRADRSRKAAASRVEFFTLVRGDD